MPDYYVKASGTYYVQVYFEVPTPCPTTEKACKGKFEVINVDALYPQLDYRRHTYHLPEHAGGADCQDNGYQYEGYGLLYMDVLTTVTILPRPRATAFTLRQIWRALPVRFIPTI